MRARREKVPQARKEEEAVTEAPLAARYLEAQGTAGLRAGEVLTLLRNYDIPCSIDSFEAKGWTAKLGDPAKGFYAQQSRFPTIDAAANWLLEEARRQYPKAIPR
jgi:hypothetical protein